MRTVLTILVNVIYISQVVDVAAASVFSNELHMRNGWEIPIPPNPLESYPFFMSAPVKDLHEKLFRQIFEALLVNGTFLMVRTPGKPRRLN